MVLNTFVYFEPVSMKHKNKYMSKEKHKIYNIKQCSLKDFRQINNGQLVNVNCVFSVYVIYGYQKVAN